MDTEAVACPTATTVACYGIGFEYDGDGLLIAAGGLQLLHNAQNGLLSGTIVGTLSDAWTYNSFGEPTEYSATTAGSATALYDEQLVRDAAGRITQKSETVTGSTTTSTYTYDDAGRLRTVTWIVVAVTLFSNR